MPLKPKKSYKKEEALDNTLLVFGVLSFIILGLSAGIWFFHALPCNEDKSTE